MIIEYDSIYDNEIEELLYELQQYLSNIDLEKYNTISKEYKRDYFQKVMNEIKEYQGKILLYKENDKIIGFIAGCINNEETDTFDFNAPKIGRITELIVSEKYRGQKVGERLFKSMEKLLKDIGCEAILIGTFAYNQAAINFYKKMGYHLRTAEMINVSK